MATRAEPGCRVGRREVDPGQVPITDGVFVVTTTADSGPGSLRQAILDSNATAGGTNTIDFDIPGSGVQMIAPASPLPAITKPVVIDGTTQPGYTNAPLIAIAGQGNGEASPLTVGSNVTVKGLALGGSSFLSVSSSASLPIESVPLSPAREARSTYKSLWPRARSWWRRPRPWTPPRRCRCSMPRVTSSRRAPACRRRTPSTPSMRISDPARTHSRFTTSAATGHSH